ncbi:hypothetical protein EDB83DRAFT_2315987 [Lactarius deliciosus]|nr:hypothetical protein EDB83DRAFT_2315987 [Lactarius deliciosus]
MSIVLTLQLLLSGVVVVDLVVVGMLLLQVVVVVVSGGVVLRPVQPGVGVDAAGGAAGVETMVVILVFASAIDTGIVRWSSLKRLVGTGPNQPCGGSPKCQIWMNHNW